MTLNELAAEYRAGAALIKTRIAELNDRLHDKTLCEMEKFRLRGRILMLESMFRDAQETALVMEKYYDREYRCNARYRV